MVEGGASVVGDSVGTEDGALRETCLQLAEKDEKGTRRKGTGKERENARRRPVHRAR
jgi:hypothetical protein